MPNIKPYNVGQAAPQTEWEKDAEKELDRYISELSLLINGGLRFEDNHDIARITATTSATPNTETAVAHGLKRVPLGYIVYSKDKAAHIYDGSTANNATSVYIRSDVASVTTKLLIF